jgi:hypothetical protein
VDPGSNISSLLTLRKLTRSIAAALGSQLTQHLSALTPVLRPEMVFGKHIQGGQGTWLAKSDQAMNELRALYEKLAPAAPFNLRVDLVPPLQLGGLSLEMTPVEYTHVVESGSSGKNIIVRCPLTWTLSYSGFAPAAFRRLLDTGMRSPSEVQRFVLAYLALHLVFKTQPGIVNILNGLRFNLTSTTQAGYGDLPITRISSVIATERPPDDVIIESAEVTGMDAFQEVVRLEDIQQLRDPLREELLKLAKQDVPELV